MSINLENPVFTASTISEIDTLEALNRLFDIEYGHVFIKDTYHRPLRSYNLINSMPAVSSSSTAGAAIRLTSAVTWWKPRKTNWC